MFRIYGKGDTVSNSEYWDGRTKYNLLQKFIQGKYQSHTDLIEPIKELITQNFEIFDFLERFSQSEVTKTGVFENSLQNQCTFTEDDVVTVTLDGIEKTYVRLPPGIIAFNGNIQINKPAVDLASKQLADFFKLDASNNEKVDIKYSYETDSFKCRIYKKKSKESPVEIFEFCNGASWSDDNDSGYLHSASLLADIYNDETFKSAFIQTIGTDLSKINIEQLVELDHDGLYSWCMNQDGFLELTQDETDKFIISEFSQLNGETSLINNTTNIYRSMGEGQIDENGVLYFSSSDGMKLVDDSGSEVFINANGDVSLTNGTVSILLSGGEVSISGNLNVQGTETTVDTQSLLVSDNIIEVNKDQTGTPLETLQSGLKVNRGDIDDYYFIFDESTDSFMIGTMSSLQRVATREDTPINGAVAFWNETTSRFETANGLLWNGTKLIANVDTVDGLHADNESINNNNATLATKVRVKEYADVIQTNLTLHEGNSGNPHSVTKAQVGLSNAPNWSGSTNVSLGASNSTIPSQAAVKTYVDNQITAVSLLLSNHEEDVDNPHSVTKSQVGLSNVPNWSGDINTSLGTSDVKIPSQKAVKTYVDNSISSLNTMTSSHIGNTENPHEVTKAQIGLGSVPNWGGSTSTSLGTSNVLIPSQGAVKSYVDNKISTHTHDSRYYTESEVDTKLGLKADVNTTYTRSVIDTALADKSSISHSHTFAQITSKPSSYPPSAHTHSEYAAFPIGSVIMFDGNWTDNVTIVGWYSCISANSTHGCPNLVDKFIAGGTTAGNTGGANTYNLTVAQLPSHNHSIYHNHGTFTTNDDTHTHEHSITSNIHNHPFSGTGNYLGRDVDNTGTTKWGAEMYHYSAYDKTAIGGVTFSGITDDVEHTHTITINNNTHNHTVNITEFSGSSGYTGSGQDLDNRPSFYSMIFIRKCY